MHDITIIKPPKNGFNMNKQKYEKPQGPTMLISLNSI